MSNLFVDKFKHFLALKALQKLNVDVQKTDHVFPTDISDFNFSNLSNLTPSLVYNTTLSLINTNYIMTRKGQSQNVKPVSKSVLKDHDNKLATFVDWQDEYSTAINCKQINNHVAFKFVPVSKYNDIFNLNRTEFTQVE